MTILLIILINISQVRNVQDQRILREPVVIDANLGLPDDAVHLILQLLDKEPEVPLLFIRTG
jgi:hypothetical protein